MKQDSKWEWESFEEILSQQIQKKEIYSDFEHEKLKLEHLITLYKVDLDLSKSLSEIVKKTNSDREKEIYYFYCWEKIFEHVAKSAIK